MELGGFYNMNVINQNIFYIKNLKVILPVLFCSVYCFVCAQTKDSIVEQDTINTKVINGDTIFIANLPAVTIFPPREFSNDKEFQKYLRLVRNVKKAYPYAVMVNEKLNEIDTELSKLQTKKEKKAYLDMSEKKLKDQFEDELKALTITQGRILIKLIYRETGNTTYYHIKELRGSFSAFFWQTMARLFGSNLKSKYDPFGEDKDIEEIIIKIQKGQI
jgi:hypothetical protein